MGAWQTLGVVVLWMAGTAADQDDALLIAFLLAWLGGLYLYHGTRTKGA